MNQSMVCRRYTAGVAAAALATEAPDERVKALQEDMDAYGRTYERALNRALVAETALAEARQQIDQLTSLYDSTVKNRNFYADERKKAWQQIDQRDQTIKGLREALKPFSDAIKQTRYAAEEKWDGRVVEAIKVYGSDLRRARAALAASAPSGEESET